MSKFFINRPIVAMVISIVMVIVGVVSMLSLPTSQFPNIVPPEILVQATFPGAAAKTLEQSVATPIEQQMNGVDNMDYMWSTNASNGQTQLNVDFNVTTDPNIDQVLSQLRVSQAQSQVPSEVNTAGITVQKSQHAPNILNSTQNAYSTVFFITLKDWAERTKPDERYTAILANLNRTMRGVQEVIGFAFLPPSIPGIGTSGGVTMILEDRSGSNDLSFLTQNLNKFMAACKKRPEIAAAVPTYLPNVPQCGRRQREAATATGQSVGCVRNHADVHGRQSGQLLQSVRSPVANLC
jgi:multidrug efflux pump subunit AcrB